MGTHRRSCRRSTRGGKSKHGTDAACSTQHQETQPAQKSDSSSSPTLTFEEVFVAIESLYADELKPFGRILRKRVAELAALSKNAEEATSVVDTNEVDPKLLCQLCETSTVLRVEPEEGGDWSATIIGRSETFVDIYSSEDSYSNEVWEDAAKYFGELPEDERQLPGGRYACAQALQNRKLPFLQGCTLGRLCHFVQLAISRKKIIGYFNGSVVPYAFSQAMIKEKCAQQNEVCAASGPAVKSSSEAVEDSPGQSADLELATWETARRHLWTMLCDSAEAAEAGTLGTVPLSNVKRVFRSRFQIELSETKLGHSKLSELLQDERFADVCTVQLQKHGYMVTQVQPSEKRILRLEDAFDWDSNKPDKGLVDRSVPAFTFSTGGIESLVQRTFIHAAAPPPTPPPNARKRSASLPKDAGSEAFDFRCKGESGDHSEDTASTVDSARCSAADGTPMLEDPVKVLLRECRCNASLEPVKIDLFEAVEHRPQFCIDDPLALDDLGFSLDPAPLTVTPTRMYMHPSAWPMLSPLRSEKVSTEASGDEQTCDNSRQGQLPQFCTDEPLMLECANDESPRLPKFCIDEPLAMDDFMMSFDPAPLTATPTKMYTHPSRWPVLSPSPQSQEAHVGSIPLSKIHNTFIHSPMAPPTPLRNSTARRSRSLPRDVGSGKSAWEEPEAAASLQSYAAMVPPTPEQFNVYQSSMVAPSFVGVYGAEYAAANWVGGAAAESTYAPTQVISLASLLQ